jgi:uncharacterized protein (DUF305 family)
LTGVICLVAGALLGFAVWGGTPNSSVGTSQGMHMMPDGTLMRHSGMDMASMMADMNAALAGKKGDEFDKAFIEEMIVHHEGAVAMAELALTNAKHKEIRTLANAIISAQTTEISQMKEWLRVWYIQ